MSESREEAFYLVDPGGAGGSEVQVVPRSLGQPAADARRFVRPVVVQDHVDVVLLGHGGLDLVQELDELDGAVPRPATADHLAASGVESCEEGGRAITAVVMRATLDLAWAHRQERRRTIQGLSIFHERCPQSPYNYLF